MKSKVSGAFFREDLGDITLPYGNDEIGLKKIYEKHLSDFAKFGEGESGLINGLSEIVEKGKAVNKNGVETIYLQKDDKTYLVRLSKGWQGEGNQRWVITSYEAKNLKKEIKDELSGANKTLSADDSLTKSQTFDSTAENIIPQKEPLKAKKQTKRS